VFDLLIAEFLDPLKAHSLFEEFLQHESYNRDFALKLISIARQRSGVPWDLRRAAILMLEHQILKLQRPSIAEYELLFDRLNLTQITANHTKRLRESVLQDGYSTTLLRPFAEEFRRRLDRLRRVHDRIKGPKTSTSALRDFIRIARRDCKLSLARYLFTSQDTVDEILTQLDITDGVRDVVTPGDPAEADIPPAADYLPEFESAILRKLCDRSEVFWVSESTSSEINSLVEYPLTTVVAVIKPPGSNVEFEIKRAGRRGDHPLGVVYVRDGYMVPPSHRLDGGSMQGLLRYETAAASRFAAVYRLIHDCDAPMPRYVSRTTIYSVPVRGGQAQVIPYFTEPRLFGNGYRGMRTAMRGSVEAFNAEDNRHLPDLPGDLGLTAQFLSQVTPAQSILCGTSSFRLDKLDEYLSIGGAEKYYRDGLGITPSKFDEKCFADELMEEILGVFRPPRIRFQCYEKYIETAFRVPENRAAANRIYVSLLREAARFWGTLMGVRGYTRGESCVARNVGLKSVWENGQWSVKIVFMDHDSMSFPGPQDRNFDARGTLGIMFLDENYLWGTTTPEIYASSTASYLRRIYRISRALESTAHEVARQSLRDAYKKTQQRLLTNPELRKFFNEDFLKRLLDWDTLVSSYLRASPEERSSARWRDNVKKMLTASGYKRAPFESYMATIQKYRAFLEKYRDLYADENEKPRGDKERRATR